MIALTHEMIYRLTNKGPLGTTDGSPRGARQYWEMSHATLSGPRINATLGMAGGDWMIYGPDGFGRPDVRMQFVTDDGALILLQYTGLVERTAAFTAAAEAGRETAWTDQYMRMTMTFDTGIQKYDWLNRHLFVARGRLAGPNAIEYDVYRVD
jgi:hypothetical protein